MKQYEIKPYSEISEESVRHGYGLVHPTTKTIVILTSLQKDGDLYLENILKKLNKRNIECIFDERYNVLHTKPICILAKTIYDGCRLTGYGDVLFFVDKVNYYRGVDTKEKVDEIKSRFKQYTKEIAFKDIAKIVKVADMLCK